MINKAMSVSRVLGGMILAGQNPEINVAMC